VRDVIKYLGGAMVDDAHTVDSKDSTIYMSKYDVYSSRGRHWRLGPSGIYNLPIIRTHTLKYNETVVPFEHWHMGRQWVAKMIGKTMSINQQFVRGVGVKLDPWGFKHPRTALLVPFWLAALKDKFVFVHVLRDGKDVVEGDNQVGRARTHTHLGTWALTQARLCFRCAPPPSVALTPSKHNRITAACTMAGSVTAVCGSGSSSGRT